MTHVEKDERLFCLVKAAQLLGVSADYFQLQRAFAVGPAGFEWSELLRAAHSIGLKARHIDCFDAAGKRFVTPAIITLSDGQCVLVINDDGQRVLLGLPGVAEPKVMEWQELLTCWTGEVVFLGRRTTAQIESRFGFAWFLTVLKQYKKQFFTVLGLSLLLQCFGLIMPIFTQVIIDSVLVHHSLLTLDILIIAMLLASLFQVGFSVVRSWIFTHTSSTVDVLLSNRLLRHLVSLPVSYFASMQAGDVVARVRELETVRRFLTGSSVMVLVDTLFSLVYFGVLFYYSTYLGIIVLGFLPFFVILNIVAIPLFRQALNDKFAAGSKLQSFLIEQVTGIETVKTMAAEPLSHRKWEELLTRHVKTSFRATNLNNIFGNMGHLLQLILNLFILWQGSQEVMAGKLSIGQLIAFQMIAGLAIDPVVRLAGLWQQFQQITVSMSKLGEILHAEIEPAFQSNRATLPQVHGAIQFQGVSFRYQTGSSLVLRQFSCYLPAGSSIGIVGSSGSGKSTMAKLIQRLYIPESGKIFVDGVDLALADPSWLRRQIGVVEQESNLFQGTIRENIRLAQPWSSDEEVEAAASLAGADSFIRMLPHGYDTLVGERGSALSGGQRQRIAIARALLINPRVLIFDEATSALDYESENAIMSNLSKIAMGRTLILIAHRLTTVRHCSRILVIDKGRIVEQGTHEELIEARGGYTRMWQDFS